MNAIGKAVSFLVIFVSALLWSAYVLSVLWGWFISPVFALPVLTVRNAIGLSLTIGHLRHRPAPPVKDERSNSEKLFSVFGHLYLVPAFSLAIGWLIKVCSL